MKVLFFQNHDVTHGHQKNEVAMAEKTKLTKWTFITYFSSSGTNQELKKMFIARHKVFSSTTNRIVERCYPHLCRLCMERSSAVCQSGLRDLDAGLFWNFQRGQRGERGSDQVLFSKGVES
jgi:hypothetical protein